MVEEELAKANAKMYSKEIERLQMAVKDTKENADAIIIEQQKEIELLVKDDERNQQIIIKQSEEIKRLNNIIGTIKGIFNDIDNRFEDGCDCKKIEDFLEILDKENI